MTTILSNVPFRPTSMEDVYATLQRHYPDRSPEYKERRDATTGELTRTFRTYTNATHHFQVRDTIGVTLESREIPI